MDRPYDSDENATWHDDDDCEEFEGLPMGDANFKCPNCDRDTLTTTPDNITDYECAVCAELVFEHEVIA